MGFVWHWHCIVGIAIGFITISYYKYIYIYLFIYIYLYTHNLLPWNHYMILSMFHHTVYIYMHFKLSSHYIYIYICILHLYLHIAYIAVLGFTSSHALCWCMILVVRNAASGASQSVPNTLDSRKWQRLGSTFHGELNHEIWGIFSLKWWYHGVVAKYFQIAILDILGKWS